MSKKTNRRFKESPKEQKVHDKKAEDKGAAQKKQTTEVTPIQQAHNSSEKAAVSQQKEEYTPHSMSELFCHPFKYTAYQWKVFRRDNPPHRKLEVYLIAGGVLCTFLTFLAAIGQVYYNRGQVYSIGDSNNINRQAVIASARAWLTPSDASIVSPIQVGTPLSLSVSFGNVGKEPALGFVAQDEMGMVEAPRAYESWYTVFKKNYLLDVCAKTDASDGGNTFYPSSLRDYSFGLNTQQPFTNDMMKGTRILYLHGCFAYRSPVTKDTVHKSEYCFMLVPDRRGGFKSVSCPYGNHAT